MIELVVLTDVQDEAYRKPSCLTQIHPYAKFVFINKNALLKI